MQQISSNGITLVDFWAPWCGPCKAMMPILSKLQQEADIDFDLIKVNVDDVADSSTEQRILLENNVKSIPHFSFYKNGKFEKALIGIQTMENLKSTLKELSKNNY